MPEERIDWEACDGFVFSLQEMRRKGGFRHNKDKLAFLHRVL